nr:MAG TPA_asm: Microtubule-associated protein RP/EB family member coil four helix.8A [Caudoviricetes sp.]
MMDPLGGLEKDLLAAADRIANQSTHIAALQQKIEKLRGQNRQLMLERNYVMSIIADVRKGGKTWMCQYCAHCKGIVSGMADCDSKQLCVMPYSQLELKRPELPEVEDT